MNGAWPITLRRRTSRRRDRPSQRRQARSDVTIHVLADRVKNTRSAAASTSRCRLCLPAGAYPKFHLELTSRKSAQTRPSSEGYLPPEQDPSPSTLVPPEPSYRDNRDFLNPLGYPVTGRTAS